MIYVSAVFLTLAIWLQIVNFRLSHLRRKGALRQSGVPLVPLLLTLGAIGVSGVPEPLPLYGWATVLYVVLYAVETVTGYPPSTATTSQQLDENPEPSEDATGD